MKWAHLPVAGGLYDQDPDLLRKFEILFMEIDEHERQEQKKRDAEIKNKTARGARVKPSKRGRRR